MKRQKEPYLKIPVHILNLRQISADEKMLLAHIYSFGAKGCWQSNQTLVDIFMVSTDTVSRWIAKIRTFIYLKNAKGYYCTIWAKSHPQVVHLGKNAEGPRQDWSFDLGKSAFGLRQRCRNTNNNTITENNKRTIASPAPLALLKAGTLATLIYRKQNAAAEIENFKEKFGQATRLKPLTPQQFEQRRTQQLAALRATQNIYGNKNG